MDPISTQLLAVAENEQEYDGCLAVTSSTGSPFITVYPFTRAGGFGTKYNNPSSFPSGSSSTTNINSVLFNKKGTILVFTTASTTFPDNICFYVFSKTTGFGSRFNQSGLMQTQGSSLTIKVDLPPNENYEYVLCAGADGYIYRFYAPTTGAPIQLANRKNTTIGNNTKDLRFNNAGTYVLGSIGNPIVYPWTDGFSSGTVNLGTANVNYSQGNEWNLNDWHPSDTVVVVGKTGTTAGLRAINFAAGWGAAINDATSPMANLTGVRFSASGRTVFTSSTDSPYLEAYAFDQTTGFGGKFSNPSTLPPGPSYTVAVSKTNDLVAVSSPTSPYLAVYPWDDNTGFGVKFSNPGSLPFGPSYSLAFM